MITTPSKPSWPRSSLLTIVGDERGGRSWLRRVGPVARVRGRGHHHQLDAGVDRRLEGEQRGVELRWRGGDGDRAVVRVDGRGAEPREVLGGGRDAAVLQALGEGDAEVGDRVGVVAEGAARRSCRRCLGGDVQHRRQVDVDAERRAGRRPSARPGPRRCAGRRARRGRAGETVGARRIRFTWPPSWSTIIEQRRVVPALGRLLELGDVRLAGCSSLVSMTITPPTCPFRTALHQLLVGPLAAELADDRLPDQLLQRQSARRSSSPPPEISAMIRTITTRDHSADHEDRLAAAHLGRQVAVAAAPCRRPAPRPACRGRRASGARGAALAGVAALAANPSWQRGFGGVGRCSAGAMRSLAGVGRVSSRSARLVGWTSRPVPGSLRAGRWRPRSPCRLPQFRRLPRSRDQSSRRTGGRRSFQSPRPLARRRACPRRSLARARAAARSSTGAGAPVSGSEPRGGLREGDHVADRVARRRAARRCGRARRRCRRAAARRSAAPRAGSRSAPRPPRASMPSASKTCCCTSRVVDADRAAADLLAVPDDVVGQRPRRARVRRDRARPPGA